MQKRTTPYKCHIFICTNCKDNDDKSCSEGESPEIKKLLKRSVKNRGWKKEVRVSSSGCMGLCDDGPNVMIHPQKLWFSHVSKSDVNDILSGVEEIPET